VNLAVGISQVCGDGNGLREPRPKYDFCAAEGTDVIDHETPLSGAIPEKTRRHGCGSSFPSREVSFVTPLNPNAVSIVTTLAADIDGCWEELSTANCVFDAGGKQRNVLLARDLPCTRDGFRRGCRRAGHVVLVEHRHRRIGFRNPPQPGGRPDISTKRRALACRFSKGMACWDVESYWSVDSRGCCWLTCTFSTPPCGHDGLLAVAGRRNVGYAH
jgi:hypothetical protein